MKESVHVREDFLNSETRDGYFITSEMKDVWRSELDILEVFVDICKRHNLRYFLYSGSLLGAVRHKGFIPWDDDIDVCMMREEYDKFLKIAPKELSNPYYLVTSATDPDYLWPFAKITNIETAALVPFDIGRHSLARQGVFLDIFPIDNFPENKLMTKLLVATMYIFRRFQGIAVCRVHTIFYKRIAFVLASMVYRIITPRVFFMIRERLIRLLTPRKSYRVAEFSSMEGRLDSRMIWEKAWFDETVKCEFEYLELDVPKCFDSILKVQYGDWRKPVKGGSFHEGIVFDVHRDYKTVLIERFGYKQEWFD